MYGSEAWTLQRKDKSRLDDDKMRSVRHMSGKTMFDRINNVEIAIVQM